MVNVSENKSGKSQQRRKGDNGTIFGRKGNPATAAYQKSVFSLAGNMLAIKLFFCFATTILFFSEVSTYYMPNDGVKVVCERVCENQLNGKAFNCDMYSSQGTVSVLVRMPVEFNWRFYVLPKLASESTFCKRVLAADQYFVNGTNRCPSSLYSTNTLDTKETGSTRRGEDLKRLLKELNEDVLTTLEKRLENNDLRSLSQAMTPSMKGEVNSALKKLMDHLSSVARLNEDINFHNKNGIHDSYDSQSKQPSRPSSSMYPSPSGYPGANGPTGYPGTGGQASYYPASGPAGYPGASGQADYYSARHPIGGLSGPPDEYPARRPVVGLSGPPDEYPARRPVGGLSGPPDYYPESGAKHYPSQTSLKNPYSQYNYNQMGQYDVPKPYDYHMNNDDRYNYDDATNLGPDQGPYSNGKNFPPHTDFGQVPALKKRAEANNEVDEATVEELKKWATEIDLESSEMLRNLGTDELANGSALRTSGFVKFIKKVLKFFGLIDDDDDDYYREVQNNNQVYYDKDVYNGKYMQYYTRPKTRTSYAKRKIIHDSSDEHGECAICSAVLKDICHDGKMVACDDTVCCWMSFNPFYCTVAEKDNSALACYNSLFNIFQSSIKA